MMRPSLVTRIVRPTGVVCYASPADGQGAGSAARAAAAASASGSRTSAGQRPRGDGQGGVLTSAEVGLAVASLLPPLPLYRRLLRAHRALPIEMKSLGDAYVKDEFHRHRSIDNPLHIVGFLTQWKQYLDGIEGQSPNGYRGRRLDMAQFEKLSDEQLYQLHELLTATKDLFDPEKAQAHPPGATDEVNERVEEALKRVRAEEGEGAGNGGKGDS